MKLHPLNALHAGGSAAALADPLATPISAAPADDLRLEHQVSPHMHGLPQVAQRRFRRAQIWGTTEKARCIAIGEEAASGAIWAVSLTRLSAETLIVDGNLDKAFVECAIDTPKVFDGKRPVTLARVRKAFKHAFDFTAPLAVGRSQPAPAAHAGDTGSRLDALRKAFAGHEPVLGF